MNENEAVSGGTLAYFRGKKGGGKKLVRGVV